MRKKILSFLLLFMAILGFATWQYRLLSILLFVLINKNWIKSHPLLLRFKQSYKILVSTLIIAIFIAVPNYYQRGRTQLAYIDKTGKHITTPINIYLLNVIFPEEEIMNVGMKVSAIIPPTGEPTLIKNLGGRFIREAQNDFWSGKALSFYAQYNQLSWQFSNPGSFAIAQAYNETVWDKLQWYLYNKATTLHFFKKVPCRSICPWLFGQLETLSRPFLKFEKLLRC